MAERLKVHLTGNIVNLMDRALVMVDTCGGTRRVFPVDSPAEIHWWSEETYQTSDPEMCLVSERHPDVAGLMDSIGWINDFFGLVRPVMMQQSLRKFWYKSVIRQHAEVRNLPDLLEEPRNQACPNYYVVTRGVALVAYYHHLPISRMLIPAIPHELLAAKEQLTEELGANDSKLIVGYEALMPARYLLHEEEVRG